MERHAILGHRAELSALERDLATGNVAHAYLFAGPRHVGKFTVATWFAEELLLADILDAEKDRVRHAVRTLIHPDLHVLDWLWMEDKQEGWDAIAKHSNIPQEHRKKTKAKTDTISIDDVRALQDRLHEVGTGRYTCALIRGAHAG
jgi:hypothetical protein